MTRLARNSIAAGLTTLLVTAGVSFSANGAEPIIAQSEASAVTATGLTDIVDTEVCRAESTGPATQGTGTCGTGLASQGTGTINQNASTDLDGQNGTSQADAAVESVDLPALTTIDPSTLGADVDAIDTGTILDDIAEGLDPVTQPLFDAALTDDLSTQIQDAATGPLTAALQDAVPVAVEIGAVTSQCTATADGTPTATSTVAGVDIVLDFGDNGTVTVPVELNTDPNSPLVGSVATSQLVEGALTGVEDSLNTSLNGVLGPLAALVPTVQQQLVDAVLAQIGPNVVDPLGDALTPVLTGTVNKQTPVPPRNTDDSIEVTALSLGVVGETATLDLARSSCGPNSALQAANDDDAAAAGDGDAAAAADADSNAAAAAGDGNAAAIADADSAADADVAAMLPAAGAPNLLPFVLLGIALLGFGLAVLLNERRRFGSVGPDSLA